MYQIFDSIKTKPIVVLGIVVVLLFLVMSITSSISSLGTMLGFDTKENTAIRLEKTNNELEKVVDVLENNEHNDKVKKEIDTITDDKVLKDAVVVDAIKGEEIKVLEQIKNTKVIEEETIVDTKPVITIKDKPTVVYVKKKLNNKQKLALSILRDRAKLLKGNRV